MSFLQMSGLCMLCCFAVNRFVVFKLGDIIFISIFTYIYIYSIHMFFQRFTPFFCMSSMSSLKPANMDWVPLYWSPASPWRVWISLNHQCRWGFFPTWLSWRGKLDIGVCLDYKLILAFAVAFPLLQFESMILFHRKWREVGFI